MNTTHTLRRGIVGLATIVLVSGGLGLAGLGLAAGTAQADNLGPFQWCPGQSMDKPTGPGHDIAWDWSVCHTWYTVDYGKGNVSHSYDIGGPSSYWDGDDPPPSDRHPCAPFCL
jgi:hypothetical protein